MKIGIDISQVVYEGTGVARFTKGFINAILSFDTKNEWVFFFSSLRRSLAPEIRNAIAKKGFKLVMRRYPPTLFANLFTKIGFKVESIDRSLDWFITSDWAEIPSSSIKKATIVHDLSYLRCPELVEKNVRNIQTDRLNRVKKESSLIFADSAATKKDLIDRLGIKADKIKVNYPGVDVSKPNKKEIKKTLDTYSLHKPYILSVGKIEPRKNLNRLVQAFLSLDQTDLDLIIVGPHGWENVGIPNHNKHIKYLGYVTDSELACLYSSCLFFVYPSVWEGFGYPVVEAMKLGAPVATSNTSSLGEIANKSAVLFDPLKIEELKKALETLIKNSTLRAHLKIKGIQNSSSFTWKNYYQKFIQEFSI